MTIRVCVDCQYLVLVPGMDRGECRRWPKAEMKDANSWCGEFKITDAARAAQLERERIEADAATPTKRKRFREVQSGLASVGYDANGSPTE